MPTTRHAILSGAESRRPSDRSPRTDAHPAVRRGVRTPALLLGVALIFLIFALAPRAYAQPASVSLVQVSGTNDEGLERNPAGRGDMLAAIVAFDKPVTVTGTPTLTIVLDSGTRQAADTDIAELGFTWEEVVPFLVDEYALSCDDPECFRLFTYVIQPSDLDRDGISIPRDALAGTITGTDGTPANLDLSGSRIETSDTRVDGRISGDAPRLAGNFSYSPPANDDTYLRGETIGVRLSLDQTDIVIEGSPRLAIVIGEVTRYAALDPLNTVSRPENEQFDLSFAYTVQVGDRDADGIELPTDPIDLNGGAIRNRDGTDAFLSLDGFSLGPNTKVDGSTAVLALPVGGALLLGALLLWRGTVRARRRDVD